MVLSFTKLQLSFFSDSRQQIGKPVLTIYSWRSWRDWLGLLCWYQWQQQLGVGRKKGAFHSESLDANTDPGHFAWGHGNVRRGSVWCVFWDLRDSVMQHLGTRTIRRDSRSAGLVQHSYSEFCDLSVDSSAFRLYGQLDMFFTPMVGLSDNPTL